jgi:hypothetical protein
VYRLVSHERAILFDVIDGDCDQGRHGTDENKKMQMNAPRRFDLNTMRIPVGLGQFEQAYSL